MTRREIKTAEKKAAVRWVAMKNWTDTTPTEPGLYWYCTPGCKHAPHLIQLQEWVNEGLVAYLIEEQGRRWIELEPRGYWLSVETPDPPEGT